MFDLEEDISNSPDSRNFLLEEVLRRNCRPFMDYYCNCEVDQKRFMTYHSILRFPDLALLFATGHISYQWLGHILPVAHKMMYSEIKEDRLKEDQETLSRNSDTLSPIICLMDIYEVFTDYPKTFEFLTADERNQLRTELTNALSPETVTPIRNLCEAFHCTEEFTDLSPNREYACKIIYQTDNFAAREYFELYNMCFIGRVVRDLRKKRIVSQDLELAAKKLAVCLAEFRHRRTKEFSDYFKIDFSSNEVIPVSYTKAQEMRKSIPALINSGIVHAVLKPGEKEETADLLDKLGKFQYALGPRAHELPNDYKFFAYPYGMHTMSLPRSSHETEQKWRRFSMQLPMQGYVGDTFVLNDVMKMAALAYVHPLQAMEFLGALCDKECKRYYDIVMDYQQDNASPLTDTFLPAAMSFDPSMQNIVPYCLNQDEKWTIADADIRQTASVQLAAHIVRCVFLPEKKSDTASLVLDRTSLSADMVSYGELLHTVAFAANNVPLKNKDKRILKALALDFFGSVLNEVEKNNVPEKSNPLGVSRKKKRQMQAWASLKKSLNFVCENESQNLQYMQMIHGRQDDFLKALSHIVHGAVEKTKGPLKKSLSSYLKRRFEMHKSGRAFSYGAQGRG
ncbi:MAG: hypothetical protein LBU87_01505 [Lactobacillales bacterium]|jgi:hypothetical protein|nr:hypothetical protein [Lactobacillales bacterium]